ncbi:unnamed protein product [Enterobius vermicularis]|uniref:COesterase domain-containing protein n=1 Tax=Enterobius vermicularis TaxID=51028 RepID=A0A0N4V0E7_ENTVE|nr:unnamed protein product [Enterobius vermicularis]
MNLSSAIHYKSQILNPRSPSDILVRTSKGAILGKHVNLGNDQEQLYYGEADIFLGVPYAKPPVGELRFKKPEEVDTFNGVWDATKFAPRCLELNMSEDCLYLNIFTRQASNARSNPVMVFINGGNSFTTGGSNPKHIKGTIRNFVMKDIVVVTIQYRLGALGFFTTHSDEFPPNLGMLDQVKALEWIKKEISHFGGNPDEITLCGQSNGACSVSAHTLSPVSQRLFKRAILQSGSIQGSPQIIPPKTPLRMTVIQVQINLQKCFFLQTKSRLLQACNMTAEEWRKGQIQKLQSCLHNLTFDVYLKVDGTRTSAWMIVQDNYFMPDTVENLAKKRPNIPIIIGTVQDEDASYGSYLLRQNSKNFLILQRKNIKGDTLPTAVAQISQISQTQNFPGHFQQHYVIQLNFPCQLDPPCKFNADNTPIGGQVDRIQNSPAVPVIQSQNQPPQHNDYAPANPNVYYNSNQNHGQPNTIPISSYLQDYSPENPALIPNSGRNDGVFLTPNTRQIGPPPVQSYQNARIPQNVDRNSVIDSLKTITQVSDFQMETTMFVLQFHEIFDLCDLLAVYQGVDVLFLWMDEDAWSDPTKVTSKDIEVANDLSNKWAEFVKTGVVSNWQPTTQQQYQYCRLNNNPQMQDNYGEKARQVFKQFTSRSANSPVNSPYGQRMKQL